AAALEEAAAYLSEERRKHTEIAFFGGSFTAIPRQMMISLLEPAAQSLRRHGFAGIRLSTRPDAIDEDVLTVLKHYGVTAIELGAQSMRDDVLLANYRGHRAADVEAAAALIKAHGFSLGLQMMTGLYGDTDEGALYTAEEFIRLQADTVRIYPAITLPGTMLAHWYAKGQYRPQKLEEAVGLCAGLLERFEAAGVNVIRVGLHDSPELAQNHIAGPYHPAFRELCESRRFFIKLLAELQKLQPTASVTVRVNPRSRSVAAGQKKTNLTAFLQAGYTVLFKDDPTVPPGGFSVDRI
ncbi:MAG: radical SAM protein, partial [Clostridia bacterium]|nr:radical SAM protein [Clostridia bacterium]